MSGLDAVRYEQEEKERIRESIHARIDELVQFSYEKKAKSKGEKYASTHEFFGIAYEEMDELRENYKCVKSLFKILCKDLRTLPDKEMAFRDKIKYLDVYLMLLIEEVVDLRVCCSKYLNRF
jgi:hypothetical protein